MAKITVTTKTPAEIDSVFEAVFKDIKPPKEARALTQADRLEPYRKAIMKQRRRGISWKQIALAMRDPRINEKVSAKLLWTVFGGGKRTAVASAAPRQHLFLDPVTGQPLPPKPTA